MDFNGWKYNWDSLPHWKDRHEGELVEISGADLALLRYNVPNNFARSAHDFCALLSNKEHPVLLLHILEIGVFSEACVSRDGRFLILRAHYRREKNFLLLLDLTEKKYAVEHVVPLTREYSIEERENGIFEILVDGRAPSTLNVTVENSWLQGTMRRVFSLHDRRWRDWRDLEAGKELNLQERSFFSLLKNRKQIWRESLELVRFGMISAQEFVDRNKGRRLYFIPPFGVGPNGRVQAYSVRNEMFAGDYLPAFTTKEAYIAYCREQNLGRPTLCATSLKRLMRTLDNHYVTREWGVVIDPCSDCLIIPPGVRVTPKSLRY